MYARQGRRAAVVISICLGALASGCGADAEILGRSGDLVLVGADSSGSMAGIGLGGTVTVVGECLGVDKRTVIWPKGTTLESTDPLTIRVPGHGLIKVGDQVVGGAVDVSDTLPDGIDEIPPGCPDQEVMEFFPEAE